MPGKNFSGFVAFIVSYPDKLQTKYTMKGETVATGHQGDSTEIADDS